MIEPRCTTLTVHSNVVTNAQLHKINKKREKCYVIDVGVRVV